MTGQPKIYVAGHRGMVGSAIVRALRRQGQTNIVTRTRAELDLTDQTSVRSFFENEKPDQVYMAAAKVGGIHANNSYPAEFIYQNLMVQANVIHEAWLVGVRKLLFLGSSCIYPKLAPQPMREDALLTGPLEPTNEPYAVAKIAGIKLCESYNRQYGASHGVDYRSVMPTNLYGPGDNYHPQNSHVIPALIRRAVLKENPYVVWGTGDEVRDFLHITDLVRGCLLMVEKHATCDPVNIGYGQAVTVKQIIAIILRAAGHEGAEAKFDTTKPSTIPFRMVDTSKAKKLLGFERSISLEDGLADTVRWYVETLSKNKQLPIS